jgi:hypothetical protein
VLARRDASEGAGVIIADVQPRRVDALPAPGRFWLHHRGALPAFVWNYQRAHGRRWYRRHVRA